MKSVDESLVCGAPSAPVWAVPGVVDCLAPEKGLLLVEIDNIFCRDFILKIKLPLLPVSPHTGFFSLPACRSHQHYGTHVVGKAHQSTVDIIHGRASVPFTTRLH